MGVSSLVQDETRSTDRANIVNTGRSTSLFNEIFFLFVSIRNSDKDYVLTVHDPFVEIVINWDIVFQTLIRKNRLA